MKVLLLTRYERLGASSRVRFLQFLPALERQGFTFDVQPLLDNAYVRSIYGGPPVGLASHARSYIRRVRTLSRRHQYDVVWLEKEAFPYIPSFLEMPMLRGVPYVVDLDDAWFHRYENHWASPVLGHKIDAVMRGARIVVAGNEYLANRARAAGARQIEIVPSAIDLGRYENLQLSPPSPSLTVGWIGIPLNAYYLTLIEPALRALLGRVPFNLHVVGAPVPPQLEGIPAQSFPWTEDTETARIAAFDVGIMPLHDTPWERGKCAYKLLQVMAAGKPVIASPVGANRDVVWDGVNGFLASTPGRWAEALRKLAADPGLRERMGNAARRTVADQYASARIGERLAAVLREAAKRA